MKFKEVIEVIERDGWAHLRTTGSHMIYKHPTKAGRVVVPGGGKLHREVKEGTLKSILRQAGLQKV